MIFASSHSHRVWWPAVEFSTTLLSFELCLSFSKVESEHDSKSMLLAIQPECSIVAYAFIVHEFMRFPTQSGGGRGDKFMSGTG